MLSYFITRSTHLEPKLEVCSGWYWAQSNVSDLFEHVLRDAAFRAYPITGQITKRRTRRDILRGIAFCRIIYITAYCAFIFVHIRSFNERMIYEHDSASKSFARIEPHTQFYPNDSFNLLLSAVNACAWYFNLLSRFLASDSDLYTS